MFILYALPSESGSNNSRSFLLSASFSSCAFIIDEKRLLSKYSVSDPIFFIKGLNFFFSTTTKALTSKNFLFFFVLIISIF